MLRSEEKLFVQIELFMIFANRMARNRVYLNA